MSLTEQEILQSLMKWRTRLSAAAWGVAQDAHAAEDNRKEPLCVTLQPGPINSWAGDLWQIPQVILGKWLPPTGNERARLGAEPVLWRTSDRDSVMLYAVALAAWKSTERPVLLASDSRFRFRGRTERAQTVRFGFSAQKMRGVFVGKFEVDVPPALLRPAGETWEVELPLRDFHPLHPQLNEPSQRRTRSKCQEASLKKAAAASGPPALAPRAPHR